MRKIPEKQNLRRIFFLVTKCKFIFNFRRGYYYHKLITGKKKKKNKTNCVYLQQNNKYLLNLIRIMSDDVLQLDLCDKCFGKRTFFTEHFLCFFFTLFRVEMCYYTEALLRIISSKK